MTTNVLSHPRVASEADLRALLETKNKVLSHDDAEGTVEILAGVTNIVDHVGDVVEPGAYARTLKERNPKGCKSHDHKNPLAKAVASEEWLPGDPRLPKKHHELGAGALYVKLQYNMNVPASRDEYEMVKFMGDDGEWSIGYDCSGKKGKAVKNPKTGYRHIKDLTLYEVSSVLAGAAPHTGTLNVKSLGGDPIDWDFFDASTVTETKGVTEALFLDDDGEIKARYAYDDEPDPEDTSDDEEGEGEEMPPKRKPKRKGKGDFLNDDEDEDDEDDGEGKSIEEKLTHITARARGRGRGVGFNPDAVDADHDMIVQEGTPFARPARVPRPKIDRATAAVQGAGEAGRTHPIARPGHVREDITNHPPITPEERTNFAHAMDELRRVPPGVMVRDEGDDEMVDLARQGVEIEDARRRDEGMAADFTDLAPPRRRRAEPSIDPQFASAMEALGIDNGATQATILRALQDPNNKQGPPADDRNLAVALNHPDLRATINTYNAIDPGAEDDAVQVPKYGEEGYVYTYHGVATSGDAIVDDVTERAQAIAAAFPGASVGQVLDAVYDSYPYASQDRDPKTANRAMYALNAKENYGRVAKEEAAQRARAKDLARADKNPELVEALRETLGITDDPTQDVGYFNKYGDARLAAALLLKYDKGNAQARPGLGGQSTDGDEIESVINALKIEPYSRPEMNWATGDWVHPAPRLDPNEEDQNAQLDQLLRIAQAMHAAKPDAPLQAVLFAAGDFEMEAGSVRDTTDVGESWSRAIRNFSRQAYKQAVKSREKKSVAMSAEDAMAAASDAVDAWLAVEFADEGVVGWVEDVYDDRMAVGVAAYGDDGTPSVEMWDVDIEEWDNGVPTLGEPTLVPLGHIGVVKGDDLECLSAGEIVAAAIAYKTALRRRRSFVYEYGSGHISAKERYVLGPDLEVKDVYTSCPTGDIEHGFSPIQRMRKRKRRSDRDMGIDVVGSEMMKAAAGVMAEVQAAVTEDMERKIGRVLSAANLGRIQAALDTLSEMVATAQIIDQTEEADIAEEAEAFKAMLDAEAIAEFKAASSPFASKEDEKKWESREREKIRNDASLGGIRNSRSFQDAELARRKKKLVGTTHGPTGAPGANVQQRTNQNRPVERDHDGDGIVEEGTPNAHRVSRPTTSPAGGGARAGGGGGGGSYRDKPVDKTDPRYYANLGRTGFDGKEDEDVMAEFADLTSDEEVKREFSREERDKAADEGVALPDGSYPIKNRSDLANAIQAYGRAKDKAACKAHIIKRARALNAMSALPDGWT